MGDKLRQYVENAILHAACTESGDYEKGNKAHDALIKAYKSLKKNDPSLAAFIPLLKHENLGVRMWSATHLLPIREKEAVEALKKIQEEGGGLFTSFEAKIILQEWSKGTLKLDF